MDHLKVTLTLGKSLGTLKSIKRKITLSGAVYNALRFACVPLDCTKHCFLSGSMSKICDGDPCRVCGVRVLAWPFGS